MSYTVDKSREENTHLPTHKYRKKYSKINESLANNPGMEEYTIPRQETPSAPYSAVVYNFVGHKYTVFLF